MSSIFNTAHRQAKLNRILSELDQEQTILDKCSKNAAEDLRWSRIFLTGALKILERERKRSKPTKQLTEAAS